MGDHIRSIANALILEGKLSEATQVTWERCSAVVLWWPQEDSPVRFEMLDAALRRQILALPALPEQCLAPGQTLNRRTPVRWVISFDMLNRQLQRQVLALVCAKLNLDERDLPAHHQ